MRPRIEEWGVFTLVSAAILYWTWKGIVWIAAMAGWTQ